MHHYIFCLSSNIIIKTEYKICVLKTILKTSVAEKIFPGRGKGYQTNISKKGSLRAYILKF